MAGAASAALDAGHRFGRVAGTSAGALVASLIAAGYGASELKESVCSIAWPTLLDPTPWTRLPIIGKHISLMISHGLYQGEQLERVWESLLEAKGVRAFDDLAEGSLKMVATDLTRAASFFQTTWPSSASS